MFLFVIWCSRDDHWEIRSDRDKNNILSSRRSTSETRHLPIVKATQCNADKREVNRVSVYSLGESFGDRIDT